MRRAAALLARAAALAAEPAAARRAVATAVPRAAPTHVADELFCRQRSRIVLGDRVPTLSPDAWVAPNAVLVGDVDLYDQVTVWHGAVLRGDLNAVRVGAFSSVGARSVLHAARSTPTGLPAATVVGRSVTIGDRCLLRSATVGDGAVVGDGSVLLEGSVVGAGAVLQPGTVVPPGRLVPAGQVWGGKPARYVRGVSKDEAAANVAAADAAAAVAADYAAEELPQGGFVYRDAERVRAAAAAAAAK